MASVLPIPAMQDLKVTVQESILVFPSSSLLKTDHHMKKSIFLSNIDQILNYNIPTVHFFKANPDFPPQAVAKKLKIALEKVLVTYDFMAGRFKLNQKSGRLEIDCNDAGVGFVVASSGYSLHDLGDFVYPNLGFRQLAVQTLMENSLIPHDDHDQQQPLCVFQVTGFTCGGFAIGMCMNHVLFDGIGAQTFIENLATQALFDHHHQDDYDDIIMKVPASSLSSFVTPCHNRHLLAARSPPHVHFTHPEFFKPDVPDQALGPPVFDCKKEELDYKIFKLTSTAINSLKEKAAAKDDDQDVYSTDHKNNNNYKITSFNVTAALIWRCKALSSSSGRMDDNIHNNNDINKERVSTLLNVIDIRSRLNPPLPSSYCGNAVLVAYASAKCSDLEEWPFSKLVRMVAEGPKRVNDEYARSVIDWLEINKGLPCGEYMVSSWMRLRFDQVVYPWGKPVHSGPVVSHRKDICWIFPDHNDDGLNALVSLPAVEMEKFESYFHDFFP